MEIGRSARISEWAGLFPAASDPARIEFDGPRNFRFPTPRPCEVEENNIVYGRLYRCAERWQERPVIILLDGSPSLGYHTVLPLIARRFNRAGFNAALLVAPYQLRRRPRRPIEENCLEFARAMAQYVAEIRALTAGCLMKVAHPWRWWVVRLGDGLRV